MCDKCGNHRESRIEPFVLNWANLTSPFLMTESQNQWIEESYLVQERRATDFKALEIVKRIVGRSNPCCMSDVFFSLC